ncbi:MAG TPA: hypothetical protein PLB62_09080, partial [Candidatus Sumerlaeota bacterium]|nr:hypothetical protein [Candidatus Sumerlaeota bacterium]
MAMDSCPGTDTIASLPFTDTDTTINRVNDYQLAKGTCSIYDTAKGPDTVYRFTPPADMIVGIRMNPTGWSSCVLYVVTDCQDIAASCVKLGDGFPPYIDSLSLTGGTTYYIICDGQFANNSGAYTFLMEEAPSNETCETAREIPSLPFSITASTWMAHNDTKDTNNCMCSTAPGPEIVYSYTPLADERVCFKMTPIAPFKFPAFYIGTNCSNITQICLVGKYNTSGSPIVFDHIPLTAGVQYNIYCDSFIFSTGGWGEFTLEVTPSTSFEEGENCADSIMIPPLPFAQSSTLSGRALDCPTTACGHIAAHDAVYTYSPPEDEWINATLAFGGFRATLAIVRDCFDPNGTCVAGKTGGSSFTLNEIPLLGGNTYYLIVGGDRSCDWGDYTLTVEKGFGPPPNDTCATAQEIDALPWSAEGWTYSGTNDYNPEDSCAEGGDGLDVVYTYTPMQSGWIDIIYRPEAGVQPTLYVVTDCENLDASCVAGCSETNGPCILLDVPVEAATTYYIICDTRTATAGTRFTLSISPGEPPVANDLCSIAEVIASLPFAASGDTALAGPNYVACCESRCGYGHGPDVVYTYMPNDPSGVECITVNMLAPSFRGALFIVSDCGDIDGSCVAGTYAKEIGKPLSLSPIFLQTGVSYYIICNGLGLDDAGPFTLNVQSAPNPFPHDKCDGARVIDTLPYVTTDTTTGARDNYSVKCCFVDYKSTGPDVVYSYTPPVNQSLVVSLTPLSDALDGDSWIYVVTDCENIEENCYRFSRDGYECLSVQAGTTYYFIIDGEESGDHGEFRLEFSAPPPPPNDICENAHVIQSLPFETADWNCSAQNDYEVPRNVSSCLGSSSLGIATGNDMVYSYTPPENQYININLTGDCGLDDWLIWVVTDCSNPVGSCVAGDIANSFFGCVASVDFLSVAQGVTYYIIVDSRDSDGEGAGMFSLSIKESFLYDAALDVLGESEGWTRPGNRINYMFKIQNRGRQSDIYRMEIAGAQWPTR